MRISRRIPASLSILAFPGGILAIVNPLHFTGSAVCFLEYRCRPWSMWAAA